MDKEHLIEQWKIEEQQGISGWDFSSLGVRMFEGKTSWDYGEIVRASLGEDDRLLDLGTGGGEFLLSLGHSPALTAVTEGYEPNYRLCMEKLSPMGIEVAFVGEDDLLPFADGSFDIVIDRHESYRPDEVRRILRPGGIFITQQVGGDNDHELSELLIKDFMPSFPNVTLENFSRELKAEGFELLRTGDEHPPIRFFDVGSLVRFAAIIKWEFPGFSVDSCMDGLLRAQEIVERDGFITATTSRFIISARLKQR